MVPEFFFSRMSVLSSLTLPLFTHRRFRRGENEVSLHSFTFSKVRAETASRHRQNVVQFSKKIIETLPPGGPQYIFLIVNWKGR
jgi:hypothetical protein